MNILMSLYKVKHPDDESDVPKKFLRDGQIVHVSYCLHDYYFPIYKRLGKVGDTRPVYIADDKIISETHIRKYMGAVKHAVATFAASIALAFLLASWMLPSAHFLF